MEWGRGEIIIPPPIIDIVCTLGNIQDNQIHQLHRVIDNSYNV